MIVPHKPKIKRKSNLARSLVAAVFFACSVAILFSWHYDSLLILSILPTALSSHADWILAGLFIVFLLLSLLALGIPESAEIDSSSPPILRKK